MGCDACTPPLERRNGRQQKQAQIDNRQQANEKAEYVFNCFDKRPVLLFSGTKVQKNYNIAWIFSNNLENLVLIRTFVALTLYL